MGADAWHLVSAGVMGLAVWDLGAIETPPRLSEGIFKLLALSEDGRRAVTARSGGAVEVWDLAKGTLVAAKLVQGEPDSLHVAGTKVMVGCESGVVEILDLMNCSPAIGYPLITPCHLWLFGETFAESGRWDDSLTCLCAHCGMSFGLGGHELDAVCAIQRNAGVVPGDSPALKLPDEAWTDPALRTECGRCGKAFRFNPFVVDGREDERDHVFWPRRD